MITIKGVLAAALPAVLACSPRPATQPTPAPEYLYLWTGSADSTQPDFLAVLDVTEDSARYGRLIATLPGAVGFSNQSTGWLVGGGGTILKIEFFHGNGGGNENRAN